MTKWRVLAFVVAFGLAVVELSASGQSGIYAVVEKVALEPSSGPPERIQVLGAFALMERSQRGFTSYVYRQPARGYMYFKLPAGKAEMENARREWSDLASVAGTKQGVAFGYWDNYRGDAMPTVRAAGSKPENPDVYLMDVGLTKLTGGGGGMVAELLKLIERH